MTPRLLLLVALALSLPAAARSEAPAPGAEPPRPATALGPEVPQGAVARFLAACHEGHYARAAEYLNLRHLPQSVRAQRGAELARELETVLERALWIDLDRLSDQPEGDPEDGLLARRDSLGTIETAAGPVEVLIERVSRSVSRSSPRAFASSRSRCRSSASSPARRRRSRSSRSRGSSCAGSTSSWRASSGGSTSIGTFGRWRRSRSAGARSRSSSRWSRSSRRCRTSGST